MSGYKKKSLRNKKAASLAATGNGFSLVTYSKYTHSVNTWSCAKQFCMLGYTSLPTQWMSLCRHESSSCRKPRLSIVHCCLLHRLAIFYRPLPRARTFYWELPSVDVIRTLLSLICSLSLCGKGWKGSSLLQHSSDMSLPYPNLIQPDTKALHFAIAYFAERNSKKTP